MSEDLWIEFDAVAPLDNSEIWNWDGEEVVSANYVKAGDDDAGTDIYYCTETGTGRELSIVSWQLRNPHEEPPQPPE